MMKSLRPYAPFLVLAPVAAICAFPLYWLLVSSFRPIEDLGTFTLVPTNLTAQNYVDALRSSVPRWLLNTLVITVATTALGLLVSSLAGFAFARYRFAGKGVLFALVIASLAIPEYATVLPQFLIMRFTGLLNTYASVVIPLAANALALFLMRQYCSQIPEEILDAARVDGASEFRLFFSVALPIVAPGAAAAGLILFLSAWNAYLLPLVMLNRTEQFTIPVGLAFLHSQLNVGYLEVLPWGPVIAGTVLSVLPILIALMILQRNFISGLTAGAVK